MAPPVKAAPLTAAGKAPAPPPPADGKDPPYKAPPAQHDGPPAPVVTPAPPAKVAPVVIPAPPGKAAAAPFFCHAMSPIVCSQPSGGAPPLEAAPTRAPIWLTPGAAVDPSSEAADPGESVDTGESEDNGESEGTGDEPGKDELESSTHNCGHMGTWAKKGGKQLAVKENFARTRQRYTILTSVPYGWSMTDHPDRVPKAAMLFKGKPDGRILHSLKENKSVKDWMLIQVQEEGSYRSEDVVEALDWMLPQAHSPDESIIVLLDRGNYGISYHLTEEVAEKVRSKGHVLRFSNGGATSFTQINDTHLHALSAQEHG